MPPGQAINMDDLFSAIQETLAHEFEVDTSDVASFADVPTHNKMIFTTESGKVFIISISEGNPGTSGE